KRILMKSGRTHEPARGCTCELRDENEVLEFQSRGDDVFTQAGQVIAPRTKQLGALTIGHSFTLHWVFCIRIHVAALRFSVKLEMILLLYSPQSPSARARRTP